MALPLVGKPRTQSKGSDQAARWLAVSLLTVWGLRVPCGLLAVWLVVGTGWPAGTILLGVCVAGAYGLHRSGRLVPLYRHERLHWRAQRIRATWDRVATDVGLAKRKPPRLWIRQAPTGVAVTLKPTGGEHHGQLEYAAKGLVLAWKAQSVAVRPMPKGRVRYDVTYRNSLADPIPYPHGIEASLAAIPYAIDEHGREVDVPLRNGHTLVAGSTGSGKSWSLHVLLAGAATCEHTALVLCDPKRVELAHWRPRASVVATDMDSIDLVLARTVLLVRDRFEQMERHGIQLLEPSAHHPHVVLVVEELAILNLGGTGKQSTDRRALVNELAFTARAASVSLIVATQQPNARTIPTDIRGQMTRRIAHATASWDESKMILGDNPAPAHLLSMAQQGTVYVAADGTRKATLARAYMLDGDQAAGIARQTAHQRVGPEVVGMPALAMPAFPDAIEID
jgi:hypothetical protein